MADVSQPKVTICHGSANHYVVITVDAHSLVEGHFDDGAPGHGPQNLPDMVLGPDGCVAPTVGGT